MTPSCQPPTGACHAVQNATKPKGVPKPARCHAPARAGTAAQSSSSLPLHRHRRRFVGHAVNHGGNHYVSRSKRGAEVAAILYTLFESAKLAEVDPHRYVLEVTRRAIASPGTVTLPQDLT